MMEHVKVARINERFTVIHINEIIKHVSQEICKLLSINSIITVIQQCKRDNKITFPNQNISIEGMREMRKNGLVTFGT